MLLALLWLVPSSANAQAAQPIGIAVGGDNLTRLVWNNPDGSIALWKIAADGTVAAQNSYGPYPGWSASAVSMGPDNFARVLCTHPADGAMSLWRVDPSSPATINPVNYGPYPGYTAKSVAVGGNNAPRILWNRTSDSLLSLWNITPATDFTFANYGPYPGYNAFQVAAGPNGIPRTLWNGLGGSISLWYSTADASDYGHSEYRPVAGCTPVALAVDSTNASRIVWNHPSDSMVSLWNVAPTGTYTYRYFTDPAGYFPVALAAGTGGDVRLLWSNGRGGALVWTIQPDGTYAQTYSAVAPVGQAVLVRVNPPAITAGNTASGTVSGPPGTTVYLYSDSDTVHVPSAVSIPANMSLVDFSVTTTAGTYDYTLATITAISDKYFNNPGHTSVKVYTPGGTPVSGGGNSTGGGGTGGGGGGTGGGGTGTGGGGTGGGGTGGGGTGGGGTGGGGTGGGGTGSGTSYGHFDVSYSGGTVIAQDASGTNTVYPSLSGGSYSGTAQLNVASNTPFSARMQGPLTATFIWVPDAGTNSPPPAQATVTESCYFSWLLGSSANIGGSYNTDLGQSGPIVVNTTTGSYGGSKTFSVSTGGLSTFNVSCNPQASISRSTGFGLLGNNFGFTFTAAAAAPLSNVSLQAHSTKDTPGWDPTHPRFFSGTNCSATASLATPSGFVRNAKLSVNGVLTKEYDDTGSIPTSKSPNVIYSSGTSQNNVAMLINFDSTYFVDGNTVTITINATDSSGTPSFRQIQAAVYNKAYSLGSSSPTVYGGTASTNAATQFRSIYHTITQSTTDNKSVILGNLPSDTVFYIWADGLDLPSSFGDCNYAAQPSSADHILYAVASDDPTGAESVTQAVSAKSNAIPPYNFVFVDACDTAQNGLMPGAFGVTTSSVDQAYLGYTTVVDNSSNTASWSNRFLMNLSSGMSVGQSQADANFVVGYPSANGQRATNYIWGDRNTKTHGVYGVTGTGWFK